MQKRMERDYSQAKKEQRGKRSWQSEARAEVGVPECRRQIEEELVMVLERGKGEC